ncbi:hypothetical protein [uncultured Tateyamaria sp.]|uniref:hypothetical protein n=1 Tax=uncultured Tateyamaria sp. TaxID=455651 RepID=UPI0026320300|nr:hypothetical protein [uncultured Tateyamaria sp.]
MQLIKSNALLRGLSTCAKIFRWWRSTNIPEGTAPPPLTPHIARDIGLSPSTQARMRHRWPSQSTQHPYL